MLALATPAVRETLFAAGYAAAAFLVCFRAWQAPTTVWVGGCCDPEVGIWFLRWTPFAISHGMAPLSSNYMSYPDGINLMWQTSSPLAGLLLWPLTVKLGPILSYNVFVTLSLALSGWLAFLALRRYTRSLWAAAIGGALFGFSPFMLSHAREHMQLVAAFTAPLFLLLLDETLVRRRLPPLRLGLMLGGVALVQMLLGEEILTGEALTALIATATLAALYPDRVRPALPYVAEVVLVALLTVLVLGVWPLLLQFLGPDRVIGLNFVLAKFSTDIANLLVPTSAQAFAPPTGDVLARMTNNFVFEATGFVGLPLLLVASAIAARWWRDPVVRTAAITGGCLAVLTMGPTLRLAGVSTRLPLPWRVAARLPILSSALPSRLMVFVFLALGVLVAVFADRAVFAPAPAALLGSIDVRGTSGKTASSFQAAFARLPAAGALALVLLPLVPRPLPAWQQPVPPFFSHWGSNGIAPGSVVLVAPRTSAVYQAHQLLWQVAAGDQFRMPDGYFNTPARPRGFLTAPPSPVLDAMDAVQRAGIMPRLTPGERLRIANDLRAKDVDAVVVGPMAHRRLMIAFFRRLLGRPSIADGGVDYWPHVLRRGVVPLLAPTLHRQALGKAAAFSARVIVARRNATGQLIAHFRLKFGSAHVKRDHKFTVTG